MHQGIRQHIRHFFIDFDVLSVRHQFDHFPLLAADVPHHPGEFLENPPDGDHAQLDDPMVDVIGQPGKQMQIVLQSLDCSPDVAFPLFQPTDQIGIGISGNQHFSHRVGKLLDLALVHPHGPYRGIPGFFGTGLPAHFHQFLFLQGHGQIRLGDLAFLQQHLTNGFLPGQGLLQVFFRDFAVRNQNFSQPLGAGFQSVDIGDQVLQASLEFCIETGIALFPVLL